MTLAVTGLVLIGVICDVANHGVSAKKCQLAESSRVPNTSIVRINYAAEDIYPSTLDQFACPSIEPHEKLLSWEEKKPRSLVAKGSIDLWQFLLKPHIGRIASFIGSNLEQGQSFRGEDGGIDFERWRGTKVLQQKVGIDINLHSVIFKTDHRLGTGINPAPMVAVPV